MIIIDPYPLSISRGSYWFPDTELYCEMYPDYSYIEFIAAQKITFNKRPRLKSKLYIYTINMPSKYDSCCNSYPVYQHRSDLIAIYCEAG